jgi:DNA polymerase-3 subunit delta'
VSENFSLEALESFKAQEPLAVELLSRASQNNRFSHAYIFTGKSSETVLNFVKAFSKILLCNSKNAIDSCLSCKVFESGQHPDFKLWVPEGEKNKIIKLEQVKELIAASQRHPITSKHQVLILEQAHLLRNEGSNALLKTLEEPYHFTTIILTVDSLDNLLPTILSRCQIIPVYSIPKVDETEQFNLESYFPKSYLEANELSASTGKLETKEIGKLLLKLQNGLWENSKNKISSEEDLAKRVELLEKLEKYVNSLDSYVSPKLVLDNLFIDLYEARDLFLL